VVSQYTKRKSPFRGAGVGIIAWLFLARLDAAQVQESQSEPILDVGGRLVVSGETVVVTGNPDEPPRDSSVATKVSTPLIETPRSISIIDRQMLDDLGAISLTQAHDYVVGLTLLDERGPAFARGFPVDFYDLRRDGLRTYSWSVREPVGLDRIQYLRGPAAILYGDGSPGALVNMVLKKPLPAPRYEFGVSGGSLGFGRLTADLTGPLTTDRRVRYRVVAASEWLDNGYDNDERRMTLMPSIAIDVGARGTLTFDTEFYDQRGRNYRHTVPATASAQSGDFSRFPWDLNINSPDYGWTGGNVSPGLRLDLGLGQRSSLHVAGRYTRIDGDINGQALAGLAPDGRTVTRFQYHEISTWHEYQSDTFAATTIRTGRIEHRLVGGVEAGLSTADSQIGIASASSLDIVNPLYLSQPEPVARATRYDVTRLGVYATDQIRFGERVIVVPALRWSHLVIENRVATAGEARSTEDVVSPSLGLVVLPRRWLSLYTTYSQGFEPPAPGQYLENGQALAPAENQAFEGGVKADLLDERLSVTGAGFEIHRTNVAEADPAGFYRQIGEAESRGLELEIVGRVTRGLAVRGGYALTSTEITRDTSGFVGRELPNAPRHKTELWMRYRFPLHLAGLMIASGVVHVSERFTGRDNVVVAPAYTRVDASTSYELAGRRLIVGVVAQNLTDRRYVTSGAGAVFFAGQPRRLAVQLTTAF
jgi:iron complex outermembrane receptor protein